MHPSPRRDLAAVVMAMGYPTLLTLTYFVGLAEASPLAQQLIYVTGKTLQFGFPLAWMLLVHGRGFRLGRATPRALVGGVAFGALVGLMIVAVSHAVLLPSGALDPIREVGVKKLAGFGIRSAVGYLALATFYSVVHSLLEEYYWRWFVFGRLARLTSLPVAMAASSVAFMAHHVVVLCTFLGWGSPLAWGLSVSVALGGAVWAWMLERCGSLVPSWLGHLLVDAAIFWVGYGLIGPAGLPYSLGTMR